MPLQKSNRYKFLLLTAALCFLSLIILNIRCKRDIQQIANLAGQKIEQKFKNCENALDSVNRRIISGNYAPDDYIASDKIATYFFSNKQLIYWNRNHLPINPVNFDQFKNKKLINLPSGLYICKYAHYDSLEGFAISLIKPNYPLQNNYLSNHFEDWTSIPLNVTDISDSSFTGTKVVVQNQTLFTLKGNDDMYNSPIIDTISLCVFYLGIVLMLLGFLHFYFVSPSLKTISGILISVVFIRGLLLYFKWPAFLYRTSLFDVRIFGNAESVINAFLGDIIVNAFMLLFIAGLFLLVSRNVNSYRMLQIVMCYLFILFVVQQFNSTIKSLVSNSTLNYDFTNVLSLKMPAPIALIPIIIYSLALLLFLKNLAELIGYTTKSWIIYLSIVLCAVIVLQALNPSLIKWDFIWPLLLATIMYACFKYRPSNIGLILGLNTLLISIITSVLLNYHIQQNQNQELELLSLSLSEKRDAIFENEFNGLPSKIKQDKNLQNLLSILPDSKDVVEQNLKQKYFSGYFDRYNIEFSLFDNNCKPMLDCKQAVLLNEGFFEDRISFYSDSILPNLFFMKDYKKNQQYIGRIALNNFNLYILMEPKQFEETGSFPDLLLDKSLQKQDKLKNFSYVVYRNKQNVSRYGSFNYPFFFQDSLTLNKISSNDTHLYFKPEENTDVIISKRNKGWGYFFTYNSYLLLLFSFITAITYIVFALLFTDYYYNSSLTRRIQTIIVVILLVAMSAVGITSGQLVVNQFADNNIKQLHDKTEVIITELNNQYSLGELFDESQKELFSMRIKEYSRLFNTPITMFDKSGKIFSTSEPKLYEYGLASPLINSHAFYQLSNNLMSSVSVNEKAGELNYLSYYTPLFNSQKQLSGFINLPYFAKQSDLTEELSSIISALINVYVILFVLSIGAGLILAGYITRPLQLIKQQFSKITLGAQNEKLMWPANDEIGKLVSEYNLMLTKLEESANLLAKSEREGAWREMAKQVAHEIKNPLTPMKLNLQYLQHLKKNNPDDFIEKFEKASAGIIEQIDSLANIATEFSHFAKLPGAALQSINIIEVINSSILIFQNQETVNIINRIDLTTVWVKGDKDQCLRVFNNVFKNALQATAEVEAPYIEVWMAIEKDEVVITVSDNGCGIDQSLQEKIFTPNFTTKSTGSGLGLAMVKNIMQGFGGTIWFESEKDKGSKFYLQFKNAEAEN